MEVTIIGGGIVGLAFALALHGRGINCRIYEAAPALRELGVGITLLPHGVRELSRLGLDEELAAIGIETRESKFYNRFGQLIYSEARGKFAGHSHPEFAVHRGRLHGLLHRTALGRLGHQNIVTDRQLTGLEQSDEGVTLQLKQTSTGQHVEPVRAAVVVACDGVNSVTRKIFYAGDKVNFTGINTWRGVTCRKPILDGRTYLRIGSIRTGKMVIYPIVDDYDGQGNQLINWVAEIERPTAIPNDWNAVGQASDFLPIYQSWIYDWLSVPDLIAGAESVLEYPMVDKDPIKQWTFGRVTLAGDAAHPMYPRGSNGSTQGLIDARTLADLLAGGGDPRDALKAYEDIRGPATARIVETNRTAPPDIVNLRVEELTGDKPFDDLDSLISQDELRALSDNYRNISGLDTQVPRITDARI